MTILESIYAFYRVVCAICDSYFELSATNYTKFEAARMLTELGWTVANDVVMCPTCTKEIAPDDDAK
jgi:hypothetical protein